MKLEEKKIQDDPGPDTGVKNLVVPGKSSAEKQAETDKKTGVTTGKITEKKPT